MNFVLEGTHVLIAVVGGVLTVMLGLVGWLLRRAIDGIDTKLDDALAQGTNHEGRIIRMETHLGFNSPEVPSANAARHRHNGHD